MFLRLFALLEEANRKETRLFALETCPPVATHPSQAGREGEEQRQTKQKSVFTKEKDDAKIKYGNIAVAWH